MCLKSDTAINKGDKMSDIPRKIYLDLDKKKISWDEKNKTDIEYLHGLTAFPVFDLLEDHLRKGAEIKLQNNRWFLFDKDGEGIISGVSIRDLLINLIFSLE